MALIKAAAHLWICPGCLRTAQIICADGTKSTFFKTKKFGLEKVFEFAEAGHLDRYEIQYLQGEINQSRLIFENDDLEDLAQAMQGECSPETHELESQRVDKSQLH